MPEENSNYDKIYQEIDSKVSLSEQTMDSFYREYDEGADAYRMLNRAATQGQPKTIFNSRVGETNRATNTLADIWYKKITGSDPYIEARRMGFNNAGQQITDMELYGVESLLSLQLRDSRFKQNLRRLFVSMALFSLGIVEEPWMKNPRTGREGTGFLFKSLLQTYFNPLVFDVDFSDYIGFFDYMDEHMIRRMAKSSPELWDLGRTERGIFELKEMSSSFMHETWSKIIRRRQRAGYQISLKNVIEVNTYHGKLDVENPLLQRIWEASGRQEVMDIKDTDWSVKIIGRQVMGIYPTPYGTWHSIVKNSAVNLFELEPIGYGVARIGRKYQKELDAIQSRMNETLLLSVLNMWKVGRYAGLRQGNIPISPLGIVKVDNVDELQPLRPPVEVLPYGMNMMGIWKEDFRSATNAKSTLQSEISKTSATEVGISQMESHRSADVAADIISETLIREHIETMHLNNLYLLDKGEWLNVAGFDKPIYFDKDSLPVNLGFEIKLNVEGSFRTQRIPNLIQLLSIITNVKSVFPEGVNLAKPIIIDLVKSFGIDPRLLSQPVPLADRLLEQIKRTSKQKELIPEMLAERESGIVPGNLNSVPPELESSPLGALQA